MASIASKTFRIELSDTQDYAYHAVRRVILHPEVLKTVKLCTGDVVALSSGDTLDIVKVSPRPGPKHCIGQSLDISFTNRILRWVLYGPAPTCHKNVSPICSSYRF